MAKGHCTERHQVWVFLFGPGPVFLLFCLIWGETQIGLGDLRVVLFWLFVLSVFTWFAYVCDTGQLCWVSLFSPLMYLSGPCHRAFTAKLEEKKRSVPSSTFVHSSIGMGPSSTRSTRRLGCIPNAAKAQSSTASGTSPQAKRCQLYLRKWRRNYFTA